MYRIGLFSQITKTTIKTLRYYDEVGLLKPAYIDPENGYRYYTSNQMVDLHKVIALRQMGFTVEEVIFIMNGENIESIMDIRKREIESQLKDTLDQLSRINYYITESKETSNMKYNAIVKQTPECIVYTKRFLAPSYESYYEIIPDIGKEVLSLNPGLKCAIPEYCFIEYQDGEYRENNINVEHCEAVEKMGVESDTIKFKKLPSITVVSVLHQGAYEYLKDAYTYAFNWIEENDYIVVGNVRESYIDGIWNKDKDVEQWLTEIQIPIAKK